MPNIFPELLTMKLYDANTIGCVIYHMFPHFVMHFHVVLYTFIASIGTWLWWLWGGVIKVLYLKCQPLPIVKRRLPSPPFYLKKKKSFQMSFVHRDVVFFIFCCGWCWLRPWVRRKPIFALKYLSSRCYKVHFAATAICVSLRLRGQILSTSSLIVERLASLSQFGEQRVSCIIHNIGLLRAWARV